MVCSAGSNLNLITHWSECKISLDFWLTKFGKMALSLLLAGSLQCCFIRWFSHFLFSLGAHEET